MEGAPKMPAVDVPAWLENHKISFVQILVLLLCAATAGLDGFDAQVIGYVAPAVIRELGVPVAAFTPVFVAGLAGMLAGGLFIAPLADWIGRKQVLLWSATFFGAMSLATAFSHSLETLTLLRFLTGIGLGASLPTAIALTAEYFPSRNRATMTMMMFTGFPIGAGLGGLLASSLIKSNGWRSVFFAGGVLPLALAILLAVALPESVRYLARKGKHARVKAILERISHHASFPDTTDFIVPEESAEGLTVRHLFREGRALGTVMLWLMFFVGLLDVFFLSSWLPQVLTDAGLTISAAAAATAVLQGGGVIAALSTGWLVDRYGFAAVLLPLFLGAALWIALLGFAGNSEPLIFLASFLAGASVIGGQTAVNVLAAAFYPTYMRATGIGWALGLGRGGSIVGPVIGGVMITLQWSRPALFVAAAIPALVGALAVVVMTRTSGDKLAVAAPTRRAFEKWE
jgi:AAHS family 4-hydroxybenzoate transporter-like MFS transporter